MLFSPGPPRFSSFCAAIIRLLFSDCFHDHKPSLSLLDNGFSFLYLLLSHLLWQLIYIFLELLDQGPLFSVVVHVLFESLLIFDVKNNMLSASASFEKNVKLFKIDCFVLGVGIVQQKSCAVYDVLRVQNFMQFNVIALVLVCCSYELFVAFWAPY